MMETIVTVASVVGAIGAVLAIVAIVMSAFSFRETTGRIEDLKTEAGNLSKANADTIEMLEAVAPVIHANSAAISLNGPASSAYLGKAKELCTKKPALLQPVGKKGLVLTDHGRQLLGRSSIWTDMERYIGEKPTASLNEVILSSDFVHIYAIAREERILFRAMIGCVAAGAEELLNSRSGSGS